MVDGSQARKFSQVRKTTDFSILFEVLIFQLDFLNYYFLESLLNKGSIFVSMLVGHVLAYSFICLVHFDRWRTASQCSYQGY